MVNEYLQILRILIENNTEKFSIRQIALKRKINYKSAYQNIIKLNKEKIIQIEKTGNTTFCSFNHKFDCSVFEVEYLRRKELLKNKNFNVIYQQLNSSNQQFILLLFGSYAKGSNTGNSDIDLLLITDNPKNIEEQLKVLPLPIHLTTISTTEFKIMLESKKFSVVSEAIIHKIILFGIEDYYRLINNAK
jgi:predicted nucleotidyltransferase